MNALTEEGVVTTKPAAEHKPNFETLKKAFKLGHVAVMECQLVATGEIVAVLCAANSEEGGGASFVPFAVFLNGNPYKLLNPPKPEGGFMTQEEAWG